MKRSLLFVPKYDFERDKDTGTVKITRITTSVVYKGNENNIPNGVLNELRTSYREDKDRLNNHLIRLFLNLILAMIALLLLFTYKESFVVLVNVVLIIVFAILMFLVYAENIPNILYTFENVYKLKAILKKNR